MEHVVVGLSYTVVCNPVDEALTLSDVLPAATRRRIEIRVHTDEQRSMDIVEIWMSTVIKPSLFLQKYCANTL